MGIPSAWKLHLPVVAAVLASPGPIKYPVYKQCDPTWGSNEMGVAGPGERNTICNEGCAMSSTAMALSGLGVEVNPGQFNTWLEKNEGYACAGSYYFFLMDVHL